jgi:pimeloyl-ACP methyl ester carboxylesterase
VTSAAVDRRVRRWAEQRAAIDAEVRDKGVEVAPKAAAGGLEAMAEFRLAARRMRGFDDIHREFAAQAERRAARAEACESAGRMESARESHFIAALLWSAAIWPLFEVNETAAAYERRMTQAYGRFAALMERPIERVEIPFGEKFLPAYLHLPHRPAPGERFAAILVIGGLDTNKEAQIALHGDRLLTRGLAALAIDGPGQGEALGRGIVMTESNHGDAALAAVAFLARHPAIDATRIAIRGNSFGSYFGTVAAARLGDRIAGFAASGICQEPGLATLRDTAPPTYKQRMMLMSGYEEEAEFDRFAQRFDLRPLAGSIRAPYMILAGAEDRLSPVASTYDLFERIAAPKRLLVYEGAGHGIRDGAAAENGEEKGVVIADWLKARLAGEPFRSEKVWIDATGAARAEPYRQARLSA